MRFDILTLFPELFTPMLHLGVTRRAFAPDKLEVHCVNPRDFALGAYRRVDDRPFGGGPGMVMLAEPLLQALQHVQAQRTDRAPVILFSPAGQTLDHATVHRMAHEGSGAILICGRYEGLDQRFIDGHVDQQLSLGDFVLSGGEIPAMALLDAVARLQPGVLGDAESYAQDSFHTQLDGLLDCPHYTRPEVWRGQRAPEVLLGGHHAQVQQWRRQQRLDVTQRLRPDLITRARAQGRLSVQDEAFLQEAVGAQEACSGVV